MIACPRCHRENPESATVCGACGAPLALGDEPAPARLDSELDLDRRSRTPTPVPVRSETGSAAIPDPPPEPPDRSPETPGPDPLRPAPPARRLAAWAIDGALVAAAGVGVPAALLTFDGPPGALLLSEAFVAVVACVYATAAHALGGATLGKWIARIRVVGADGLPPAPAVSAVRTAWAILSVGLAGAGLLPALLTPSRRALHDLLAGTRVVEAP